MFGSQTILGTMFYSWFSACLGIQCCTKDKYSVLRKLFAKNDKILQCTRPALTHFKGAFQQLGLFTMMLLQLTVWSLLFALSSLEVVYKFWIILVKMLVMNTCHRLLSHITSAALSKFPTTTITKS